VASAILYFDLGSPYVYLALERLERFDVGEVTLRPIALGALFKATGRSSWGLGPERERGMAEVAGRASAYGLPPVRWPEGWPGNYLHANRACLVAEEEGVLEPFARAALRAAFARGVNLADDGAVLDVAQEVGLERERVRERIGAPEIKEQLRANTAEARAAGVIGVPALRLGGRVFWGDDQLESAAASLR
jgi:2-hydroxychromene-2-carboxylate isomerase